MIKRIRNSLRHLLQVCCLVSCAGAAQAASPLCAAPNAAGASLCQVDPAIDSAALCNDGTRPVFWIRPGSGAGAHRWLIWLEGGGECVDTPSCIARAQGGTAQYLTADGFAASAGSGVTGSDSAVNPLLYNANAVLLHYCSSDDWSGGYASGAKFKPDNPATWNFEGRRIAVAAIATLKELGLDFEHAKQILLGGSSAGGIGASVVVNDLLAVLPPAPDIRFTNDAGFVIDIGQFDPSAAPPYISSSQPSAFDSFFWSGIQLWHGRGDAKCDAAAQNKLQHVLCYDTATLLQDGFIGLPSFVAESRIDTAQLSKELCANATGPCSLPHDTTTPAGIYANAFGSRMAKALQGTGAGARYAVYSPDAYLHGMLADDTDFTTTNPFPGGKLAPRDAFDQWLKSPSGTRIVDIGTKPGIAAPARHTH